MTGTYTVQSFTDSIVTIDIDIVAISVSFDRVPRMLAVATDTESSTGQGRSASQSEPVTKRSIDGNMFQSADLENPGPAEDATDQAVGHRGLRNSAE